MIKIVRALRPEGFGIYRFDSSTLEFLPSADAVAEATIVPGFVDIHTHGAFGIDFMSASTESMVELADRLAEVGYEAFLPTTVSASRAQVEGALQALPDHPMIWGFHLEGPFISPKYPGAQPKEAIVDPPAPVSDWDAILDDPRLKVITLAPERPGALPLALRLSSRGVKVSMGHTDATYEECRKGFEAGVRHSTHTYNAMRPLHHREAGTVGFAFTEDELFTELIYDRHHVCREAAEVLVRCKPKDRLIAISDSAMAAGLPSGQRLTMWGLDCVVNEGTVRLTDGTLAGSAITLYDAFRNLAEDFGLETAIRACSINPRLALGRNPWEANIYVEVDSELKIQGRYVKTG